MAFLVFLIIALAGCAGYFGFEWWDTSATLSATQNQLQSTQQELSDTLNKNTLLATELENTEAQLEEAQAQATYWETLYSSIKPPRYFESKSELESWLAEDDTDSYTYIPDTFDCDDFAMTLQKHALDDGYIISCEYVPGYYWAHMLNTAIIGNSLYKIEPQTDEVTFLSYLD